MKYSEMPFPLEKNIVCKEIGEMWKKGWLDCYDKEHFLIRCIYGDDKFIRRIFSHEKYTYEGTLPLNADTFIMNLSVKLGGLIQFFGEEKIKHFIMEQMSAGKKHYNQNVFFKRWQKLKFYFILFPLVQFMRRMGSMNQG